MYPHKNTMMNIKLYNLSNMILKTNWLIHFKSCFGKETVIRGDWWSCSDLQETSGRVRFRKQGRASHSCRDGGGWECYLQRSGGQARGFNSLPVSAAGMTKLISLLSGIHVDPIPPTLILSCLVLSSAFFWCTSEWLGSHSDVFIKPWCREMVEERRGTARAPKPPVFQKCVQFKMA